MTASVFISYKTGDELSRTARNLVNELRHRKFDVWFDEQSMEGGSSRGWNEQIYEGIARSDVLIVLLAKETIKSKWVRREVDVAKGAQAEILPILIKPDLDADKILKEFDIAYAQYVPYLESKEAEIEAIVKNIERLAEETRSKRREWFEEFNKGKSKPIFKHGLDSKEKVRSFKLHEHWGGCKIHLATGDVTNMHGIDVLINPENSYMQMARVFDTGSVSSKVRVRGSRVTGAGHLKEDTVQQELYEQITKNSDEYGIPIAPGYVVPTTAGHSRSFLCNRMDFRYVFHVVTVTVHLGAKQQNLISIQNEHIDVAVERVCDMIVRTNEQQGVIAPPNTQTYEQQVAAQGDYEPIRSVIFPMFATGRGGRETEINEIASELINSVIRQLRDYSTHEAFTLTDIYLCAYSQNDRDIIEAAMDELLVKD